MPHDLLTHPEKQRIIDVVGLVKRKRQQSRKRKTAKKKLLERLSFICPVSSSCGFGAKRNYKNQNDRPEWKNRKQKPVLGCVEGRGVEPGEQGGAQKDRARQKHDRTNKAAVFLHAFLGKKQIDDSARGERVQQNNSNPVVAADKPFHRWSRAIPRLLPGLRRKVISS